MKSGIDNRTAPAHQPKAGAGTGLRQFRGLVDNAPLRFGQAKGKSFNLSGGPGLLALPPLN